MHLPSSTRRLHSGASGLLAGLLLPLLSLALLPPSTLRAQRIALAGAGNAPVVVESGGIQVEVNGAFAVTTYDLIFRNPNARNLEGTFELPLLEGQDVVRFALDMNGVLREAVPVDKDKGRVVFEEIERRRVDPGLLEKTEGNFYRARIFPLPANGTRHILVSIQERLPASAKGSHYRLQLPFEERLKNFSLHIQVADGLRKDLQAHDNLGLGLDSWKSSLVLEVKRQDFQAEGLLDLELPPLTVPAVSLGEHAGKNYFLAEVPLPPELGIRTRPAPKTIGLLWDSSGSGSARDHKRELALLDALFRKLGNVEVRLYRIRNLTTADGKSFHVSGGSWQTLREALEETAYDGASSLDGLDVHGAVDEWLCFSDGLMNFGNFQLERDGDFKAPVHTVNASAGANDAWLRRLAEKSGGEYVNLLNSSTSEALNRLRSQSPRLLRVEYRSSELAHVYPEPGATLRGSSLEVTGELRKGEGDCVLLVGYDEKSAQRLTLHVPAGTGEGILPARAWAQAKLAQLALEPEKNREALRHTAQDFGIVTATTSLLVLESAADYARYDITPPRDLAEEVARLASLNAGHKADDRFLHLQEIVRRYLQKKTWWEQNYPKDQPPTEARKEAKEQSFAYAAVSGGTNLGTISVRQERSADTDAPKSAGRLPHPTNTSWGSNAAPAPAADRASAEERVELSPFMVTTSPAPSPKGESSLAGRRIARDHLLIAEQKVGESPSEGLARSRSSSQASTASGSTLTLKPWSPNEEYLERLRRAAPEQRMDIYLEERVDHANEPGFFLVTGDFFLSQNDTALGIRILSNLAELGHEDIPLLRILGRRLLQANRADLALPLFERIRAARLEEPQGLRDLALACDDLGQHQRAVELLWELATTSWNGRFPDIELTALTEMNAILACHKDLDTSAIDQRLLFNLPVGLRVVLSWDADNCDMDLWVWDPNGEAAYYGHQHTYQGGRMSADFTAGYGPEEFMLREPKPGNYRFGLHYFGDRRLTRQGPVTALVTVYRNFGTPKCTRDYMTLRLQDQKESADVGRLRIE